MLKGWSSSALLGCLILLFSPAVSCAQMMNAPPPNFAGFYGSSRSNAYYSSEYHGHHYYEPSVYASPGLSYYSSPQEVDTASPASIDICVPADSALWFEGEKTSQTGSSRSFVSPPLQSGRIYTYEVRARWNGPKGKPVEETRQVRVQAGRRALVDFTTP